METSDRWHILSNVAAIAILGTCYVSGAIYSLLGGAQASAPSMLKTVVVGLNIGAVLVWYWVDCKASKTAAKPFAMLFVAFAPMLAIPYHFNQTRPSAARTKANLLFVAILVFSFIAYNLGLSSFK